MPSDRVLTVFAFDPTQARRFGNVAHVQLPFEELTPGPVGRRLEVIDYDASNRCYYRAVDLDDPEILRQGGLAPSESNPQFHQQMAYAVAQQTIHTFQLALGRPIRWAFWRQPKGGGERLRLRIHPRYIAHELAAWFHRPLDWYKLQFADSMIPAYYLLRPLLLIGRGISHSIRGVWRNPGRPT